MKYTKRQIMEAIAYWERQLKAGSRKVNESLDYSHDNPYSPENCVAQGWVAYFMKDGFPYLPVDFSMNVENPTEGDEGDELSQSTRQQVMRQFNPQTANVPYEDGVQTDASFFGSAQEARDAVDIANLDSGAYFGTCCYLGDCQILGLISEDDYAELEDSDVKVIDTYVCGNGAVIFGYDALEDNADEWERENR